MGVAAEPGCSNARDSAMTMGDADGPKRAEGMVDITTPDKTNKTPILLNY